MLHEIERNHMSKPTSRSLIRNLRDRSEKIHANDAPFKRAANRESIIVLIVAILTALCLNRFVFQVIRVDGPSMLPNFHTNERVLAEKITYAFELPERFQVVICTYPEETQPVIKRVIALPGETVEVRSGKIRINGEVLDESHYWDGVIKDELLPMVVPEDHIFVVGDNRNNSWDSRHVGPVSKYDVIGHVVFRIWPLNSIGVPKH